MGSHLMRRPPKFVHAFIDRHGQAAVLFPAAGLQAHLPPWPTVVAGVHGNSTRLRSLARAAPRSELGLGALENWNGCGQRLPATLDRSPSQALRRPRAQRDDAFLNGFEPITATKASRRSAASHVERLVSAKAGKPGTALNFLGRVTRADASRDYCRLAVPMTRQPAFVARSFARLVFTRWTESDIAAFEAKHPIGLARPACLRLVAVHGAAAG